MLAVQRARDLKKNLSESLFLVVVCLHDIFFINYFYLFCFILFQFPGGGPPGGLGGLGGMPGGLPPRLDMPPVSMASSRQEHLMSLAASSAAAQALTSPLSINQSPPPIQISLYTSREPRFGFILRRCFRTVSNSFF